MKSEFTPGPWSVFEPKTPSLCYEGGDYPATIVSDGVHIATMPGARTRGLSDTARANARLIAAAPDLLLALERLVHPMADDEDVSFARDCIANARGK